MANPFAEGIVRVGRVKGPDGKLQTAQLLDVCREVVVIVGERPRLAGGQAQPSRGAATTGLRACSPAAASLAEKLGTGFALVKSDVGGNIDRLASRAATNPAAYEPDLFQMVGGGALLLLCLLSLLLYSSTEEAAGWCDGKAPYTWQIRRWRHWWQIPSQLIACAPRGANSPGRPRAAAAASPADAMASAWGVGVPGLCWPGRHQVSSSRPHMLPGRRCGTMWRRAPTPVQAQ